MCIIYDKGREYPSWTGKIYPSTNEEGYSTCGNIDREGIPGIF